MAKKNRKIVPQKSQDDNLKKSAKKSTISKKTKEQTKSTSSSKVKKKPTTKSVGKSTKKDKEKQKVGGFSKNNFNFIRSLLWKNHRSDFISYFDPSFIRLVREIFNDCKAAGVNCTEEVIEKKYEQLKSDDKRPKPYILPKFKNPTVYYEIKDVPFETTEPYLYVISPMIIPYPHEFRITEYFKKTVKNTSIGIVESLESKGYDKFFSKWVNWCNASMRSEYGSAIGSEDLDIYFKMTDAEYNESKKRWETYIYTCTSMGKVFDFGYKPEGELEKDEEPDYKLPTETQALERPISEKEKNKIKRITKKQKINDSLNAWGNFFSSVKKSSQKEEMEKYAQEISELQTLRKELEKLIRKYKKEKNTKKLKQVNKEYDLLTDKYLKLVKKKLK